MGVRNEQNILMVSFFWNCTGSFGGSPSSIPPRQSIPCFFSLIYGCPVQQLKSWSPTQQEVSKHVIQSAVNNLQGARLVESLLLGKKRELSFLRASIPPLCQVFVYTFISASTIISDATSRLQQQGRVLISWRTQLTPITVLRHRGNPGGVILQRMNQGKMKCTPDAFRWL